jgi:ABC-type Fe3+/spermidine/putrescine transport system ATPase subunit
MTEIPRNAAAGNGAITPVLEIAGVAMHFGGIVALDDVTFAVAPGRIVGLIGPNGAGKTTLFNCLSRLYRPALGDIRLNGQSLRRCAPSDIAALGVGRTFQASTLFASMSVLDNVKVGAHARGHNGPLTDAFTLPSTRSEEASHAMGRMAGLHGAGHSFIRPETLRQRAASPSARQGRARGHRPRRARVKPSGSAFALSRARGRRRRAPAGRSALRSGGR